MSDYDLSIVVPTHGRPALVHDLLEAIAEADLDDVRTEVLIIDSSAPSDHIEIAQYCATYGARLLDGPTDVRRKRNMGIAEAQGEIVFFIDSDCIPEMNVFKAHLACYRDRAEDAVLGVTEFRGEATFTWRMVQHTRFLDSFNFARTLIGKLDSAPWGPCTNLSVRHGVLSKIGGFDTDLPFRLGGDDVDLGRRINESGYRIHMLGNAVVYHTTETWNRFDKVARRAFRWGRTDFHVTFRKRPEILRLGAAEPVFVFVALLVVGTARGLLWGDWRGLALPIAWLLLYLVVFALVEVRSARAPFGDVWEVAGGQVLNLLFEFGTILEGFRNCDVRPLFLAPIHDPRQAILLWEPTARRFWAVYLSMLLALAVVLAT